MGRIRNLAHRVNDVVLSTLDVAGDLGSIKQQLDELEYAKKDRSMFDVITAMVSRCVLVSYLFCSLWLATNLVSYMVGLQSGGSPISDIIGSTVFHYCGPLGMWVFFTIMVPAICNELDKYSSQKNLQIIQRENAIRLSTLRIVIKYVCKTFALSRPSSLSVEEYADSVLSTVNVISCLAAPLVALFAPGWHRFFRFSHSIGVLARFRDTVFGWIRSVYGSIVGNITPAKVGAISAILGASLSSFAWFYFGKRESKRRSKPTRVVPKKKQWVVPIPESLFPVDPRELHGFAPSSTSYAKTWPEYPTFRGVSAVEASIVRINGSYGATCFRVGQNLVTAGHCVAKKENVKTGEKWYGVPCYNPIDEQVYWAPLEKFVACSNVDAVMGDGIAICSLPNHDFFLTRQSVQLAVPTKDQTHVGAFRTQGFKGMPTYTFSISPCTFEDGIVLFKASIEPGTSGGPIINPDGSVMGVSCAHDPSTNVGMVITQEIVDFLKKGGGAKPDLSGTTLDDQYTTESGSTTSYETSSDEEDEIPNLIGNGQAPVPQKRSPKSKSSTGHTQKESSEDKPRKRKHHPERRKKPPQKPAPPPPEAHISS